MTTFMVVATIRDDTDMAALRAVVPEEIAAVERLRAEGLLGAVHVAFARRTVFLESLADDEQGARDMVLSLPMGRFFDLDVFATDPPGPRPSGSTA